MVSSLRLPKQQGFRVCCEVVSVKAFGVKGLRVEGGKAWLPVGRLFNPLMMLSSYISAEKIIGQIRVEGLGLGFATVWLWFGAWSYHALRLVWWLIIGNPMFGVQALRA